MPVCTNCSTFFVGAPGACTPCADFAADPRPEHVKMLDRTYKGRVFATFDEAASCALSMEARFSSSVLIATLLRPTGPDSAEIFLVVPYVDKERAAAELAKAGFPRHILTYPHGDDRRLVPTIRYGKNVRESKSIAAGASASGLTDDLKRARATKHVR